MIVKGTKINDRYQIIRTLGEGGMANVYLAYDTILDRDVAVKVLRGDLANEEKFVLRFRREALSASNLNHPNIVKVYDVGEDNGDYYIVMEYVEGKTLKQLLKKRGKLTVTEVIDIMSQLTDGMAHAHDSNIIHRDIKPQNIMILDNGMIKITDFGIATALNSTQLTQTNSVMGSVHYLPPEQAAGKGSTIRSDIYSMGILMYELLSGQIPYRGDNAVEIALKHLKEPLPSIREFLPDLPQSMENVIIKSTAKNPKNRYADARVMHNDLITAMDPNRENEEKYVYKYSEIEESQEKITQRENEQKRQIEAALKQEKKHEVEEEKMEKKKQNKILIILASIFTGLIVITACIVILLPKIMKKDNITVPDVSALSLVDASNKLTKLGFNVIEETKSLADDEIEIGYVVKTSPETGKIVKEGSSITLYISSGEESFLMEDYKGKNYIEIKTILETMYKCNVIIEKQKVSSTEYKEDTVIKTNPSAKTKVKKGATVTIYIPEVETKYPDFTAGNYTPDDVEKFCKENDLTFKIQFKEDDKLPAGTIVAQSRPSDTVVAPGMTFTITVTKLKEVIPGDPTSGIN
ncbi:MAG: Stk1 family PASTA domain-containing Ser/Thr kinase [Bacilli bacterium]